MNYLSSLTSVNWVREYYEQMASGKIVVSKRIYKVYEKLVNDMDSHNKYVFDEDLGNKPIDFIETFCKQSQGEWLGQPVKLELFQKAFIQALFGFVDKDKRTRRFNETMFLVARKNGKSTLLSALALYLLIADGEGGSQVYSVASKKDQARIVFDESSRMVSQSPLLNTHIKKRRTDLYFTHTFSKFEALASDSSSLDGLNSHGVIIDELHTIKDRNLYEVMKQSMSARRQPLLMMITTAGTVRECIFDDMYEYASKVADGVIDDDRFLPIMYELDSRDEWTQEDMWHKANPSLGAIKKVEDLQDKVNRAKNFPQETNGILCKDFNVRENVGGSWLTFEEVNNTETFSIDELRDSYAIGGADLSATTDLTCATLIIMKKGSEKKYVIQQYFIPEEVIEKKIVEDKVPYDKWRDRGLVTLTSGNRVDYTVVTNWFVKMFKEYEIRPLWIYFDSWNAQYWVQDMRNYGFEMVECRQGYKTLSPAMRELSAELSGKRVNYNNNPILKWNLSNVVAKQDENGNIRPVKGTSTKQRIDGMVSLLIAYVGLVEHYADYKSMIERE